MCDVNSGTDGLQVDFEEIKKQRRKNVIVFLLCTYLCFMMCFVESGEGIPPLKPPAAPILAWAKISVKIWFTMNHGGCAVPYELSKNRAKGIDPYSMFSVINFLALV